MFYAIDIIVILIMALSVFLGFKRGFVKTFFSCFSLFIALFLASAAGPHVGTLLKQTPIYDAVEKKVGNEITEYVDGVLNESAASSALSITLDRFGFDKEEIKDGYGKAVEEGVENPKEQICEKITDKAASCLVNALGVVIVFVAAFILLEIAEIILCKIVKLPVLNIINRVCGLAAGFVLGIFGVFVLCMILEVLLPFIPPNPILYMGIYKKTTLYQLFLNLNPVISMLFS